MADFTRLINPIGMTWIKSPGGFASPGISGKLQLRSMTQIGRIWQEEYPILRAAAPVTRAFLSYVDGLWRNQTIFDIVYLNLATPLGTISGSPTVNGAGQTGSTITVTTITGTFKQGDLIKFSSGVDIVYNATADVANGATSIPINPPIFAGGSPAHGAAITYTGVKFHAVLHEELVLPKCARDQWYAGLVLKFRETA